MTLRRPALLALALCLLAPSRAHSSAEEFSTLDVARPEEDDENSLDHLFLRHDAEWREAWERAPLAYRTSQGCVTSGQWVLFDELKLQTPTGRTSRFDVLLRREHDNQASFEWLQFEWGTTLPWLPGRYGGRFRPDFDKAQQDFAGWWELGDDSARVQVRATFTIEDAFNELWSFRQARVGDGSQPYEKHPYEPALRIVWRGGDHAGPRRERAWNGAAGTRVECQAQWMTHSIQRIETPARDLLERRELWGAKGDARAEARFGRWALEASGALVQASRREQVLPAPDPTAWWNRQWAAEVVARAALNRTWTTEARWRYEERARDVTTTGGFSRYRAVDRLPSVEVAARLHPDWRARIGVSRDRITSRHAGNLPLFTYGDRFETRVHVGLSVRLGRVWIQGIEGIELDREPYEVSFHHDKGFLQLQATF